MVVKDQLIVHEIEVGRELLRFDLNDVEIWLVILIGYLEFFLFFNVLF